MFVQRSLSILLALPLTLFGITPTWAGCADVSQSFGRAMTLGNGGGSMLATGDFNGDGHFDLVSGGYSYLVLRLSTGAGTFASRVTITAGTNPFGVVAVDLTGDGILDLATANVNSNNVTILQGGGAAGVGNGTFNVIGTSACGTNPLNVVAADLNEDGLQDLVVSALGGTSVGVMLGTGGGAMAPVKFYPAGNGPAGLAIADLDGDGRLDVLAADVSSNTLAVLRGNGVDTLADGTFAPPQLFTVGNDAIEVAVADLDGDGRLDCAVTSFSSGLVSVLRGQSSGLLGPATHYTVGSRARGVVLRDFNDDGILDMAVSAQGSAFIRLFIGLSQAGLPTGTFDSGPTFAVPSEPTSLLVRDLDEDGRLDLAMATLTPDLSSNVFHILHGQCTDGPPLIQAFTPSSGAPGDSVMITGVNFAGATDVKFNGVSAAFVTIGSTEIRTTVPASTTTGAITVTTPFGTGSSTTPFLITPGPRIDSASPLSGKIGATILIHGVHFASVSAVRFGGTGSASFSTSSDTAIVAIVDSGATQGSIHMTNPSATTASSFTFQVLPPDDAGWQPGGIQVWWATALDQQPPKVVGDGLGGAYFAHGSHVQHLRASGDPAPGWVATGISMAGLGVSSIDRASDGGIFIALQVGGDIGIQKLTTSGTVAPGWPTDGLLMGPIAGRQEAGSVSADANGGAFISWKDGRAGNPDIYALHLASDGTVVPGWPSAGRPLCTLPGAQDGPITVPDGSGGVYVGWASGSYFSDLDLLVQHITSDGLIVPGWPVNGRSISTVAGYQMGHALESDGQGGAFVAWSDSRSGGLVFPPEPLLDIYLQRLHSDGTVAAGWPSQGQAVCIRPNAQQYVDMVSDGIGGVLLGWEGSGVARITSTGNVAPGWPVDGLEFTDFGFLKLAPDISGGVYVSGETSHGICVRQILGDASNGPGYGPNGVDVSSRATDQYGQSIASDGSGGAILAWYESPGRVYAQRFQGEGPVATTLDLVSAEVGADVVRLSWYASLSAGQATVFRRGDASDWQSIGTIYPGGDNTYRFEDHSVAQNEHYAYRLGIQAGDGWQYSRETWITTQVALEFSLAGARPNPSRAGELNIAFSLATAGAAELSLFDVSGRLAARRDLGILQPGSHRVPINGLLAPGVFWVKLRQGDRHASRRVVITN